MPLKRQFSIRPAGIEDAPEIARMVLALTEEIGRALPAPAQGRHFDLDQAQTSALCRRLLQEGHYHAVLAVAGEQPVAVATLAESHALYAGGKIGILQELYVEPAWRTAGLGAAVLQQALAIAAARGCVRVELCTPPLPQFDRTLAFYTRHGFDAVGGRKMRRLC